MKAPCFPTLAMMAVLLAGPVSSQDAALPSNDVRTDHGVVQGSVSADGSTASYLGIPFAAPPVGPLRWRAPQPAKPWHGVLAATRFSADCMQEQPKPGSHGYEARQRFSEDCLYLNVWTPRNRDTAGLPVMFWIYGGTFTHGGASQSVFDGQRLAERGVVVVTVNYRLGSLGFMAHPDLTKEAGTSGNYGLLDQIAGLDWVKRNIAGFGGDPAKVTIFGESAGAISVQTLMATPAAQGLFSRAIVQSGPIWGMSGPSRGLKDLEGVGQRMAARRGLKTIAEMRRVPADQLLSLTPAEAGGLVFPFFPILDGKVLRKSPAQVFAEGLESPVPMIVGYTADEFSQFVPANVTPAEFEAAIKRDYGADADKRLALFPHATPADARKATIQNKAYPIYDGSIAQAELHVRRSPTWVYRFDRIAPGPNGALQGAPHGSDVAYTFDAVHDAKSSFTGIDHRLAADLVTYWTNFAKFGNPNGKGASGGSVVFWPSYSLKDPQLLSFGDSRIVMPVADLPRIRASRRSTDIQWLSTFNVARPAP